MIDVNPRRSTYNKIVKHITVNPALLGLRGIVVASSSSQASGANSAAVASTAAVVAGTQAASLASNGASLVAGANNSAIVATDDVCSIGVAGGAEREYHEETKDGDGCNVQDATHSEASLRRTTCMARSQAEVGRKRSNMSKVPVSAPRN